MAIKFKVTKENILDGLQRVQNVVSTRTTLPILSNALLQADKDGLSITATDLDVGVRCTVEAEVSKPGTTTLPARKLFSILKEVPAAEIEIEVDEKNHCSIRAGASFYKINGLAAEEFPPGHSGRRYHYSRKYFAQMSAGCSFSASANRLLASPDLCSASAVNPLR